MGEPVNRFAKSIESILRASDSVKLRVWDDPEEYSDAEKAEALCALFDAADEVTAILAEVANG